MLMAQKTEYYRNKILSQVLQLTDRGNNQILYYIVCSMPGHQANKKFQDGDRDMNGSGAAPDFT